MLINGLAPVREYFTHIGLILGEGLQNVCLRSAFGQGKDLYRAISAMTRSFGLHGLIRRSAMFSHFLRQARV